MPDTPLSPRTAPRLAAALLALLAGPAAAELTLVGGEELSVTLSVEAAVGAFFTRGTNFGAGRVDARSGAATGDTSWGEGYVKPTLDAARDFGAGGAVYGTLTGVASLTGGEGDPAGSTRSGDGRSGFEVARLGWRSAPPEGSEESLLDLSWGQQDVQLGDGFLIQDGNLEQLDKGAYWLAPRTAFRSAALARINTHPVRADLFYLESDRDQDRTELAGVQLEYRHGETGSLGLLYFQVLDAAPPTYFGAREGMQVLSLRASELTPPALPELSLWGEYVAERGSGRGADFHADAWYLEGRYRFSEWPWSPALAYRYARFSGDANPADATRRDFDPFFYGWSRSWGTWFQGEVVGEYLLFNSNQVTHMLHLSASPREQITVGALGYRFDLEQRDYDGTAVSSRRFADEIDLYLDWTLSETVSVSAVYGVAFPRRAAREAFGDDETFQVLELALYLSF